MHGGQRMPRAELTRRVEEALRHPAVRCLSHPMGRIIGRRPENALDLERVFEVAREHGVALEVNGLAARLDLSGEHVREALRAGVRIVCSTDAHSVRGLANMPLAVHTARRGGATRGGRPQRPPAQRDRRGVSDFTSAIAVGQDLDPLDDRALGERRVAEDQAAGRPPWRRCDRAPTRRRRARAPGGGLDDGRLVDAVGQVGHEVQPGGDPGRLELGQPARQRGEQRVAAAPVERAHPAQVAIELAAVQEVGEGELIEDGRAAIGELLGVGDASTRRGGHDEPAQPQPGRERLARGPGVDDEVRARDPACAPIGARS